MIKYRAFVKTVELGSITKAAAILGYSQPGLSHILTSLEEKMGFPLLIRSKSLVEPTEDGKKLLEYCYRIIDAEDKLFNVANDINGILSGSIRIGAPNSMLVETVPKAINQYNDRYPNIEVFVQEDTLAGTQRNLQNGSLDIAFLTEDFAAASKFKFYPLFEDKICLVMHSEHPFTQYHRLPVSMLDGCDFIMQFPGWDDISQIVLQTSNVKPNIKHYCASDAASFAMVANNLGVYIISKLQIPLLPPNVAAREFQEDYTRTIGIAVKSVKTMTAAQKEFVRVSQESRDLLKPSYE